MSRRQSVEEARAGIATETNRLYEGFDELNELLDVLVAAVRREAAQEIREHEEFDVGGYGDGLLDAALIVCPSLFGSDSEATA